jgi:hypothetical protein
MDQILGLLEDPNQKRTGYILDFNPHEQHVGRQLSSTARELQRNAYPQAACVAKRQNVTRDSADQNYQLAVGFYSN